MVVQASRRFLGSASTTSSSLYQARGRHQSNTSSGSDSISHYIAKTQIFTSIANQYLQSQNPYHNLEKFLKSTSLASHALPVDLRSSLYDFKTHGNVSGYYLIRNLPSDKKLIDTPENLKEVPVKKQSFYSEFWLASIGNFLGDPFSYIQENNGNLFHNVRPDKQKAEKLSSESSLLTLDLHSETAFHPLYPDWLLLFCLRKDRTNQAQTIISSLPKIKNEISPRLESVLRQPLFKTGIDFSFSGKNASQGDGPIIPILYGDTTDPLMIFDPDLMLGITNEAKDAICQLKSLFDLKKEGILLEEGDLLLIDNHRAVHGRNKFTPFYDGKDRWLQRIYVTTGIFVKSSKLHGKKERIVSYEFNLEKTE